MQASLLRLLVVLLCISSLICTSAAPVSRTRNLMLPPEVYRVLGNTHLENRGERLKGERVVIRRMDVELNDYPGSGANPHHTPIPKTGN
ncbi:hypothetical protein RHMOL_Rhmol12G0183000 [Rhododendron molle]|uniref:Uncharacterized protein n=1 Tax=Rhododendron molle TaxID=49168 RepID=A0ACC0LL58_RHOML|nr:hypothetical protein RHMOL_Rhmol12G0183000 [Rhododendron molle]